MYNNYYQPNLPQTANYQQPPRQITTPIGLKGRPVSSIDEARATSIDFDGSVFYFPDLANKCIYTKQINLDGTTGLSMILLKKVLCHEIVYAAMFSYNVNLTLEQEELVADLIATYGEEIIEITNQMFKKIKGAY